MFDVCCFFVVGFGVDFPGLVGLWLFVCLRLLWVWLICCLVVGFSGLICLVICDIVRFCFSYLVMGCGIDCLVACLVGLFGFLTLGLLVWCGYCARLMFGLIYGWFDCVGGCLIVCGFVGLIGWDW